MSFLTDPYDDAGSVDITGLILTCTAEYPGAMANTPFIANGGLTRSYIEFTASTTTQDITFVMLANGGQYNNYLELNAFGTKMYQQYPQLTIGLGVQWTSNSTLCVAYNEATGNCWFRINNSAWNGSAGASPADGTGGLYLKTGSDGTTLAPIDNPYKGHIVMRSVGSITANIGPNYAYPRPTGFNGWNGVGGSVVVNTVAIHDTFGSIIG